MTHLNSATIVPTKKSRHDTHKKSSIIREYIQLPPDFSHKLNQLLPLHYVTQLHITLFSR